VEGNQKEKSIKAGCLSIYNAIFVSITDRHRQTYKQKHRKKHRRHLTNTTEPSTCGADVAFSSDYFGPTCRCYKRLPAAIFRWNRRITNDAFAVTWRWGACVTSAAALLCDVVPNIDVGDLRRLLRETRPASHAAVATGLRRTAWCACTAHRSARRSRGAVIIFWRSSSRSLDDQLTTRRTSGCRGEQFRELLRVSCYSKCFLLFLMTSGFRLTKPGIRKWPLRCLFF